MMIKQISATIFLKVWGKIWNLFDKIYRCLLSSIKRSLSSSITRNLSLSSSIISFFDSVFAGYWNIDL